MAKKKRTFETPRILSDLPLEQRDTAQFHFDEFAITLARLIADKETRTPLTIGISGAWGSGKTTLLRRIKYQLDETNVLLDLSKPAVLDFVNEDEVPQQQYRACRTVWFDVWKYAGEDQILAALLRVIVEEMRRDGFWSKIKAELRGPKKEELKQWIREAYFVPEGTPLNTQLLNFQREKRRIGLVVDEYGDILGLVTLEDILEEIVGEFTSDPTTHVREVHRQEDGTFLVDGSANVRELNRVMHWKLPTDGPKTFSGLITEHMESIPEPGTSLMLAGYPIEIVQTKDNIVKTAQINPDFKSSEKSEDTDQSAA